MLQATIFLADFAQATPDGKMTAVGMGWSVTGPNPVPHAVGVFIQVPWDQTNQKHRILLELLDADGEPVLVETPEGGETPIRAEGELIAGRSPEMRPGSSVDVPFAIFQSGLPVEPGGLYVWRLSVNGETRAEWRRPFSVRSLPPGQIAA